MTSVSPSSLSISETLRSSVQRLQSDLTKRQTELASGKLADAGLALGGRAGQINAVQQQQDRLKAYADTNALAITRLDSSQAALGSLSTTAQGFLGNLIAGQGVNVDPKIVGEQASTALNSLVATLNTTANGEYVFAGINTDVKPIADYPGTPPGAAKTAVDNAFQTTFGVLPSDPAAAAITPAALGAFIDNQFASLFDPANFAGTFSAASDTPVQSAISASQTVDTSVSANAPAIRKLFQVYTLVSELSTGKLSSDAYAVVVDKATKAASQTVPALADVQSALGVSQAEITTTGKRIALQQDILTKSLGSLQDVDPYETNTRINALTTQIEAAYSLTSRLQQLSLLKYL